MHASRCFQLFHRGCCLVLSLFLWIHFSLASAQGRFSLPRLVDETAAALTAANVADIDGDGDADLVALTHSDESPRNIVWFENDGAGSFAASKSLLTDIAPALTMLQAADLDGDGDSDLLVGDGSTFGTGGLFWIENENRSFQDLQSIDLFNGGPFQAIDYDRDGDFDVLRGGLYVGLYENTGASDDDGRFLRRGGLAPGPAGALAAADFDGDGDVDLAASHHSYERGNDLLPYYEQRESEPLFLGLDRELLAFPREAAPYDLVVRDAYAADMDTDGALDLVVSTYLNTDLGFDDGRVRWYRQTNSGLQGPASLIADEPMPEPGQVGWGPTATTVADLDGDGDHDVLVAWANNNPDSLAWYENPAMGGTTDSWVGHPIDRTNRDVLMLTHADLDGDADRDLVALEGANADGTLVWYENLDTETGSTPTGALPVPDASRIHTVWPNPSRDVLTVEYEAGVGDVRLTVFDVLGRQLMTHTARHAIAGVDTIELELASLAAGAYVLKMKTGGAIASHRFVVVR